MQQIGKQVFVAWFEVAKANSGFWADLREKGKKLQKLHVRIKTQERKEKREEKGNKRGREEREKEI